MADKMTGPEEKVPLYCSQRWILAYISFLGFCVAFSFRDNVNVAIVCMVKTNTTFNVTSVNGKDDCIPAFQAASNYNDRAEFQWDSTTKSAVLASFFYGYIVTQIPGGWLADKYGGKHVLGYALLTSAILTVLMPVSARTSIHLVCVVRGLIGLMQAVTVPAMHSMWSRWAPVLERSKLTTLCYSGTGVGSTITLFISGLLCDYGFDNGWGSIFYLTGATGILWSAAWFYISSDSPRSHPRISQEERQYIENNTVTKIDTKNVDVPWLPIIKSPCVWACMVAHVCCNWTNYTLSTNIPSFMRAVLKFDIKQNGALSAVPYIGRFMSCIFAGHLADALRSRGVLSTTATRKLMQIICVIGSQICLIGTGFCSCEERTLAVVLLSFAVTFTGYERAGFFVNHIDFAQRYAGILFGITNTVATVPGMVAPVVAGLLTPHNTQEEWRNVFYVCAGIDLFGMIIFVIFGSGETQTWSKDIYVTNTSRSISKDIPNVAGGTTSGSPQTVREINMTLRYGKVNFAFEVGPVEESAV